MRKCFYGYSQNTTGPLYCPKRSLCTGWEYFFASALRYFGAILKLSWFTFFFGVEFLPKIYSGEKFFFYKFLAWMREQKKKSIITLKYLYTTLDNIRLKNVPKSLNLALWMKWNVSAILVPIPLWNKWFHLWILQGNFSAKSKTSKESIKTFDFKIKTYFITDVLH